MTVYTHTLHHEKHCNFPFTSSLPYSISHLITHSKGSQHEVGKTLKEPKEP